VRDATQVDHKLSNAYLSNAKLKDVIVSFIVRGRLQLLQCNSLLSLYYPNQYTKRCTLCNHPTETVSHVLNGCTKYQAYYQSRHNRIVDIIAHHIQTRNGSKQILKDTCLTPQLFDSGDASFVTNAIRPDITLINRIDHEVFIIEVAVPFDAHIDVCYATKFEKYMPLCLEINSIVFFCRIVVFVFGSLGHVHSKVVPGMKILGIPAYTGKWLARYLSVSAAIGSFRT
jgi:hypothetical protein